MSKKRVFISFDYDNDAVLKDFLVGQSKLADSPFEFVDGSVQQHLTGDWKEKARAKIKAADIMIVICGTNTNKASGVAAEVSLAQEENTTYFLLSGYSDKTCVKPTTANSNDKLYNWTWENLKILIGGGR